MMGGFPHVPLPEAVIDLGDDKLVVRGLSRAQALRLRTFDGDVDAMERFVLASSVGATEDEAEAWRQATPNDVVDRVVDQIIALSAMTEEASKSDGESAD